VEMRGVEARGRTKRELGRAKEAETLSFLPEERTREGEK
jgi:hypothetical protein